MEETELDDVWDDFVRRSPNGTGMLLSAYLKAVAVNKKAYYCYKSKELMGAVLLPVSDDGRRAIEHDFIIYSALIYRDFPFLNRSQQCSEQFKIQTCAAEFLMNTFEGICFSLHPSIVDIRAFLWVNYGSDLTQYESNIRYTSTVDISTFTSASKYEDLPIYQQASVARRQEIRYALKEGVVTEETIEIDRFVDYYARTMKRQGIEPEAKVLEEMSALLSALFQSGMLLMIASSNNHGMVGSMAAFLVDNKRAYYLFGANDPEMRNQHTGTAVLWDAFYILAGRGCNEVDLEGVNSPARGWFKLSFGGVIVPYYQIIKRG